jgi:hypothetical protein
MKRKAGAKPGKPNLPSGAGKAKGIQARRTASDAKIDAQRKALKLERYEKVAHQRIRGEGVEKSDLEARKLASLKQEAKDIEQDYKSKIMARKGISSEEYDRQARLAGKQRDAEVYGSDSERAHIYAMEKIRNLPSTHLRGATGGGGAERVRGLMGMGSAGGTAPKKFVFKKDRPTE